VESETLKTFCDAPDEVEQVYVIRSLADAIEISWDAPEDNNSPITSNNIYLTEKVITDVDTVDLSF
jgi:hypothetical protein